MIVEKIPLKEIAYARSGDKGSHANIGLFAYTEEGYQLMQQEVSPQRVQEFFAYLGGEETVRYELPHLLALNFVLKGVFKGGALRSLRLDAQGKALGQMLLELPIAVPEKILARCKECGEGKGLL